MKIRVHSLRVDSEHSDWKFCGGCHTVFQFFELDTERSLKYHVWLFSVISNFLLHQISIIIHETCIKQQCDSDR